MKKLPLILLLLLSFSAWAQEKESFYVFNKDWGPTTADSAVYFVHIHRVSDTCWQFDYYHFTGPLLSTQRFWDSKGTILHGASHYYNEKGWIDSTGMYKKGKKDGDFWRLSSDSFHVNMKYVYKDDVLVETIDLHNEKRDTSKKYADERESEFPGAAGAWMRYLNRNLKYPDRAVNASVQGEVRVGFIVDKEGHVEEPYIARSVEYSIDEEGLRIIKGSGKWVPAFQNGKIVKSYKIQPIGFKLQ